MHGRPRAPKGAPVDPEKAKASKKRAELLGQLAGEVLARHAERRNDSASLDLAARLLEQLPESYTAWNYRRQALQPLLRDAEGGGAVQAAVEAELALTQRALQVNPKSYGAWFHRRWLVAQRLTPLEPELALVSQLLKADERNFHGWAYRRWLVALMGRSVQDELAYTQDKIEENFSNYSAWHARTRLLAAVHAQQKTTTLADLIAQDSARAAVPAHSGGAEAANVSGTGEGSSVAGPAAAGGGTAAAGLLVPGWVLEEEYALAQSAFFTDPQDSSTWFYHRWLLGHSQARWAAARSTPGEPAARLELEQTLEREAGMCLELLDVLAGEAGGPPGRFKWPALTLARLRELQAHLAEAAASAGQEPLGAPAPGAAAQGASTTRPDQTPPLAGSAAASDQQRSSAAPGAAASSEEAGGEVEAAGDWQEWDVPVAELYRRLCVLDPLRCGYYDDAAAGRAAVLTPSASVC